VRVEDALAAIQDVARDVEGLTQERLAADPRRVRAMAFSILVIGEACGAVPADVQQRAPEVPWALLRGLRNRIVHEYFVLDVEILWDTATVDLPTLVEPLRRLLESSREG
jgi:uncharacterized protein with HEPN domain